MNARILFLIIVSFGTYGDTIGESVNELVQHEQGLNGDQFCNYVYRRYYFVKRLHNTMLLFLDVENKIARNNYKHTQLDRLFNFTTYTSFHDMRIQRSIDVMKQKRSLKPLFMIWDDFTGYKSIKDQIFVEEFTKEVFIISRNMLISLHHYDEDDFELIPPLRINASSEQLLDDIDDMTRRLCAYAPNTSVSFNNRIVDLHTFAHVDDVMMRFYIIKRLKCACTTLHAIEQQPAMRMPTGWMRSFQTRHGGISWQHPTVISCLHVMDQTQSVEPLIELWSDVLQYKYVQDDLFMHEFVQLIFCTYTDLITWYSERALPIQKNVVSTAIQVYQMVDQLPLEEILDIIDLITNELPPLLEKYEFDSEMPWRTWLRKYWWAPPAIIATLAVRFLINWELKHLLSDQDSRSAQTPIVADTVTNAHEGDQVWNPTNSPLPTQ